MYHFKKNFFKAVFISSLVLLPFVGMDNLAAATGHSDNSLVAGRGDDRGSGGWGGRGGGGAGWGGRKASDGNYGGYNRSYDRGFNRGYDYNRGWNGGGVYFNLNPGVGVGVGGYSDPYYYNQYQYPDSSQYYYYGQ